MDSPTQLSSEQKCQLKLFQEQIQKLSQEAAQEYLLQMARQMMVKDNIIRQLLDNI